MPANSSIFFHDILFSYANNAWTLSVPELRLGNDRMACIVGPNGSGKSTLLRLAAGLLTPCKGVIHLEKTMINAISRRAIARRIGFLPQDTPPLFDLSVETIVEMGRYTHTSWTGALSENDYTAVNKAILDMGIDSLRRRTLSQLSGGERKRALIASALAQEPAILLLDEPTSALDIHHAAGVMRLLAALKTDNRSVIIVTHDLNLAALFSERIILLANGRIIADGTPADVIKEDLIRQAYGENILIMPHPETGSPIVVAQAVHAQNKGKKHASCP